MTTRTRLEFCDKCKVRIELDDEFGYEVTP